MFFCLVFITFAIFLSAAALAANLTLAMDIHYFKFYVGGQAIAPNTQFTPCYSNTTSGSVGNCTSQVRKCVGLCSSQARQCGALH